MLGALANSAGVLFGGLLGALLGSRIKEKYTSSLLSALALASVGLGVVYCIGTDDPLCLIVCLAAGTFIGELLRIDDGVKGLGALAGRLAERSGGSGGRFTQAFVSCSIIFCVGSMSVMGSVQSGLNGDNSILFAKAVLDFVASLAYGAALGAGVPRGCRLRAGGGGRHRPARRQRRAAADRRRRGRDVRRRRRAPRRPRPRTAGRTRAAAEDSQHAPGACSCPSPTFR